MIVGVEGIHTWDSGIVLNDRSVWPHYWIDNIAGLYQLGDFSPETDEATHRLGEVPREGDRSGKTLVYEGRTRALTLASLHTARSALLAAFQTTAERKMVAAAHEDYEGEDELPPRSFWARCLETTIEEEVGSPHNTAHGHQREFTLSLRLSDPRYYHLDQETAFDNVLGDEGGTGLPLTPGDALDPPSSQGLSFTTANPGTADVDALLTLKGPARNPVVSNETTDHFLRFRDLTLEVDELLEIDFRARTIKRPGPNVNVRHKLDPASTWWDRGVSCLVPGDNLIKMRGYEMVSGSRLDIEYYPADY